MPKNKSQDISGLPSYELNLPHSDETSIPLSSHEPDKSPEVLLKSDSIKYGVNKPQRRIIYAKIIRQTDAS